MVYVLVAVIVILSLWVCIRYFFCDDEVGFLKTLVVGPLVIAIILGCGVGIILTKNDEPKAIDVYRHKTSLQVVYKDSVAIDSTVVWK